MKKSFIIGATLAFALLSTSCKDLFSDINNDPEKTEPTPAYLFTGALVKMDMKDYLAWFWNSNGILRWSQATTPTGGNEDGMNRISELEEEYNIMIVVKTQIESLHNEVAKMPANEALRYKHMEAMTKPMLVYMGINATDTYGSLPYSEAGKVFVTNPPIFNPKFETQEQLFNLWLTELDDAINILSNDVLDSDGKNVTQFALGQQDFVYRGDAAKWAKFANSLKLKIAVRLLHKDKARALKIAEEVGQKPLMDNVGDDFLWAPGSMFFGTSNELSVNSASKHLIDFLVQNQDPRVRFLFSKNEFDENVTSEFIAEGKPLPSFIDQYVEYTTDANGKQVFGGWKAPGEPWVRYHGTPIDIQAKQNSQNVNDYFTESARRLNIGNTNKSYRGVSLFQEELLRGSKDFNYPSLPGVAPKQDNIKQPLTLAYMTSAETNLYLAELKILGANLPKSAEEYYKNGITLSVELYNKLAATNKIPYYSESTGLPTDATIELKAGEIDALLGKAAYQLTGSVQEQLEKVYIQEYLHFIYYPNDLFTTVRRSGYPSKTSSVYPYQVWDSNNANYIIPRRKLVRSLTKTDGMYQNKKDAFEQEGFTPGSSEPSILASERVWYDQGAPEFGSGSNY